MKYVQVKVKIADNVSIKLPAYKTMGAACADVYAYRIIEQSEDRVLYGTGLYMEVPEGKVVKCYIRSGAGIVEGFALANGTGIIDSDYRGELMVCLVRSNVNTGADFPSVGERICQLEICDVQRVQWYITENLTATGRNTGGLGSTGK